MLNVAGVLVYTPANFAQGPTEDQMYKEAKCYSTHSMAVEQGSEPPQNPSAAGWVLLYPKTRTKTQSRYSWVAPKTQMMTARCTALTLHCTCIYQLKMGQAEESP